MENSTLFDEMEIWLREHRRQHYHMVHNMILSIRTSEGVTK